MSHNKHTGFTLIELLVVISVIAVLMAILMPSLRMAKQQAAAMNCMGNTKTLALAWYVYAGENDGRLVGAGMNRKEGNEYIGWIREAHDIDGNIMSERQTSPPVEDEDEIRGIMKGKLYPYIGDPGSYHCPADNIRRSMYDNSRIFTSYVVPMCLNGNNPGNSDLYKHQIRKLDKIKRPVEKYNFVESAEPRNWNQNGHFAFGAPEYTGSDEYQWWGPLAVNHGNASVLGFCDGHAEKHKWRDSYTLERTELLKADGRDYYGFGKPYEGETEDIAYMARGWAYKHRGK